MIVGMDPVFLVTMALMVDYRFRMKRRTVTRPLGVWLNGDWEAARAWDSGGFTIWEGCRTELKGTKGLEMEVSGHEKAILSAASQVRCAATKAEKGGRLTVTAFDHL
jgi:hypothetical protein